MPVVRIDVEDGLELASGFVSPASYRCVLYCRVPDDQIIGGRLKPGAEEAVLRAMYGEGWRHGNEDGSRFVVTVLSARPLAEDEVREAPWMSVHNDKAARYWFFQVFSGNQARAVTAEEL